MKKNDDAAFDLEELLKARMAAWKALPEPKISWEGFKRQWQREQAKKNKNEK